MEGVRGTIKRKREHEETDGYINQYGIADNKKEKLIRRDENSISVGVDRTKLWLRWKRKKREREAGRRRGGDKVERNNWYLGMGGERERKKNRVQSSFRYGYRSSRVRIQGGYQRVKPGGGGGGGGTKACKNHICSERNVFTSGILCTEDSRLADQRSRGIQAERKRAWRATPTCFLVVGFVKVVKQRHRVPFMDFCSVRQRQAQVRMCSVPARWNRITVIAFMSYEWIEWGIRFENFLPRRKNSPP